MPKLYEIFKVLPFQKRIVAMASIQGNTVNYFLWNIESKRHLKDVIFLFIYTHTFIIHNRLMGSNTNSLSQELFFSSFWAVECENKLLLWSHKLVTKAMTKYELWKMNRFPLKMQSFSQSFSAVRILLETRV
mgnify:CR=1 FL=1